MTIGEYLIHLALIELAERAANNNLYFDYERSEWMFVTTQDFDHKPLEKYRQLFGGKVFPADSRRQGNMLSDNNSAKGSYSWTIQNQKAYLLCKVLLPYLTKTNKFHYCQALMMEYMSREGNPYRQDDAESA
jgi:hypothetical protein